MKMLIFTRVTCSPCHWMKQQLDGIHDFPVPIEFVDVDDNPQLGMQYRVRSVPTIVITDRDGATLAQKVGAASMGELHKLVGEAAQ